MECRAERSFPFRHVEESVITLANDTKTREKQTEVYECEASPVDYSDYSRNQPPRNSRRSSPPPLFSRTFAFRLGGMAILLLILLLVVFVKLAGVLLSATFAVLTNPRALALLGGAILIFLLLRSKNSRR